MKRKRRIGMLVLAVLSILAVASFAEKSLVFSGNAPEEVLTGGLGAKPVGSGGGTETAVLPEGTSEDPADHGGNADKPDVPEKPGASGQPAEDGSDTDGGAEPGKTGEEAAVTPGTPAPEQEAQPDPAPKPDQDPVSKPDQDHPPKPAPDQAPKPKPEQEPKPATKPPAKPAPKPQPKPQTPEKPAGTKQKLVALTFDDGPDAKYTGQVLDILGEYHVKATFFVVGQQAEKYPAMLKRILKEGHTIGNHTYSHANLPKKTAQQVKQQIVAADDAIEKVTGDVPSLFRAPYGAVNDTVLDTAASLDKQVVGWSVDTRDWAGTSVDGMVKNLTKEIKPGGIVLMHSFGGHNGDLSNTLEALPLIINYLQDHGFTLVTADELLASKKK
ncbi:polysaccharide deacetylase family protein [Paenibacillus gansuensis]|uniref:Polysaccharide deacetylase family protein n=1 Tax=Paenibacillus gansuensis TaxID=306542 RepID=A0ABW5PKN4_9BACL